MRLGRVGASLGVFRGGSGGGFGWLGRGFGVLGKFLVIWKDGGIFLGDLEGLERFGGVRRDFEGWNGFR